jgi:hypothetical protein
MAADAPEDMSLEQQKLVRALVKALTDILQAVRAIANAVTP